MNNTISMTTKEIAEVTGKRHDNVLQDVRRMLAQLYPNTEGDSLKIRNEEIQGVTVDIDQRGFVSCITLDKHHTFTLVSGYYARMRMAAIKYIDKLEEKQRIACEMRVMSTTQHDTSLLIEALQALPHTVQVDVMVKLYQHEVQERTLAAAQATPRRRRLMSH